MTTSGNLLPAPVEKMLSDFTAQNFPFVWNISNDGINLSVNLSWKIQDQRRRPVRSLHMKSQSTVRRDGDRMTAFLQKKDTTDDLHLSPGGKPTQETQVSRFACAVSPRPVDRATQTERSTVSKITVSTQTLTHEVEERGTNCDIKTITVEAPQQTDNILNKSVSVQTEPTVSKPETVNTYHSVAKYKGSQIEKIVRRKRDRYGHEQCLIKFLNQPAAKNRWIHTTDLDDMTDNSDQDNKTPALNSIVKPETWVIDGQKIVGRVSICMHYGHREYTEVLFENGRTQVVPEEQMPSDEIVDVIPLCEKPK
jgi:hypothetical protein